MPRACLIVSSEQAGIHSAQEKSPIIVKEVDAWAFISHLVCLQFRLINVTKPRETNSEHSKCFMMIAKSGKNQQRHHAKQLHCSRKHRVWIDGHDSRIPQSLQLDEKFRKIVLGCKRTMKAKLPKKTTLVKAARLIPAAKGGRGLVSRSNWMEHGWWEGVPWWTSWGSMTRSLARTHGKLTLPRSLKSWVIIMTTMKDSPNHAYWNFQSRNHMMKITKAYTETGMKTQLSPASWCAISPIFRYVWPESIA